MEGVAALVAERIHRRGPIAFGEVVEMALYHPESGFYETGGSAGRGNDFLTSPEVGPLFGAVVARSLDHWWRGLGQPDPFVLVEAGAGRGTLARAVLRAEPACSPALRYLLVERSAALREQLVGRLPMEPPGWVLGPVPADDDAVASVPSPPAGGAGPVLTALSELPTERLTGVVLANELLDNQPFDLLELTDAGWCDVLVGEDDGELIEVLVPSPPERASSAQRLAPEASLGARIPWQSRAAEWLRTALQLLDEGRVVVFDYADTTSAMASRPWSTWVRTYRSHGHGEPPLSRLGQQDITCDVAVDQLAAVAAWQSNRSQAEWLAWAGLDELVEQAQAEWQSKAARPDLSALAARSRLSEARALTDSSGLGGFRVLEWVAGARH